VLYTGTVIETHTRTVRIGELEVFAEAALNNCSSLWTATASVSGQLVASGASTTPEGALDSAIELAERKLATKSPSDASVAR